MNLHQRIKEERERLGYSQTAFAALAESSKHSQINWEKGAGTPTAAVLSVWATYGLDVLYVVTGQRNSAISTTSADPAEQVLLDSYRRCGAQAKQNLIQTAALLSAGLGAAAGAAPTPSTKPRTKTAAGGRGNIRIDGTVHGHVVQGDVVQHGPVSVAPAHIDNH